MEDTNLDNTSRKAIIEFNLEDIDAKLDLERYMKSLDMALVLWELIYNTKKIITNRLDVLSDADKYEGLELFYVEFNELLNENGIDIDKLIS